MRNVHTKIKIFIIVVLSTNIYAQNTNSRTDSQISKISNVNNSYFFCDKESNEILSQIKPKSCNKNKKTVYKLSGILFVNAKNWTVWINGKMYNSLGKYNGFSIEAVSGHSVVIRLTDGSTATLLLDTNC